uniref:C2H2-type domain-containing protein n=1 Tax=Steinernema glaseri TaxID=37863 RepID=A0A1I7Z4U5_9BILA
MFTIYIVLLALFCLVTPVRSCGCGGTCVYRTEASCIRCCTAFVKRSSSEVHLPKVRHRLANLLENRYDVQSTGNEWDDDRRRAYFLYKLRV